MDGDHRSSRLLLAAILATARQATDDAREIQARAAEACQRAARTVAASRAMRQQRQVRRSGRAHDASGE